MAISASEVQKNLLSRITRVNAGHAPVGITSRRGDAVLITSADHDALQVTSYLLRMPANARRMMESLAPVHSGERGSRTQQMNPLRRTAGPTIGPLSRRCLPHPWCPDRVIPAKPAYSPMPFLLVQFGSPKRVACYLPLFRKVILAIIILLALCVAVPGGAPDNELNAAATKQTPRPFPASSDISPRLPNKVLGSPLALGLAYGDRLPSLSAAELAKQLDDAVDLHARVVRLDLSWADIQPQRATSYDWSSFDRVVEAANVRHLSLLPILAYTPVWARPSGCRSEKCAPAFPLQFSQFARAAASRYAAKGVHAWEIWNEPNVSSFWLPSPDPVNYAKLLTLTASAIKSIDPLALVSSGGLAPALSSGGDVSPLNFFEQFSDHDGLRMIDAVGYHPYSYPVLPSFPATWNAFSQIATTERSLVSILLDHGQPKKAIWITEYGAPTDGPGVVATTTNPRLGESPDHVDETTQADMATASIANAMRIPNVQILIWYTNRDLAIPENGVENYFGLRRSDGTPKPAYATFRASALALSSHA